MNGTDSIYILSSDEDEPQKKKKRIEPVSLGLLSAPTDNNKISTPPKDDSIICLESDEDTTDSQDVIIVSTEKDAEKTCEKENKDSLELEKPKEIEEQSIKCDSTSENPVDVSVKTTKDSSESSNEGERSPSQNDEQTSSNDSDPLLNNTENLPSEAVTYLTVIRNKLEGTKSSGPVYKKFPTLIKIFRSLGDEFSKSEYLKNFINKQTKIANQNEKSCIVSFRDVYEHLKTSLSSEGIELSKKHWKHVRKLEKVMQKILEKLEAFNEEEVDFDGDENDSPYLKHERYSKRLCSVYKKYCKILKKNPYAGRITHERLDFVSSHYNEINLAICKKYKNNSVFPSFDELSAYIHTVVEDKNLKLTPSEVKVESEYCFKKLGDLLQLRRKKELYEGHCSFILDKEDPAERDEELDTKLRISSKEGKVKIEQVCEEFVRKQELGTEEEEVDCESNNDSESDGEEEGDALDDD